MNLLTAKQLLKSPRQTIMQPILPIYNFHDESNTAILAKTIPVLMAHRITASYNFLQNKILYSYILEPDYSPITTLWIHYSLCYDFNFHFSYSCFISSTNVYLVCLLPCLSMFENCGSTYWYKISYKTMNNEVQFIDIRYWHHWIHLNNIFCYACAN